MVGLRGLAALAVTLGLSSPAAAHLGLHYPPSRYGDSVLKIGPCGLAGGARSEHVTVLESGTSLEVVWDEYVDHPGHFRISFDVDGDDDFADPPCLDRCTTRSPVIQFYSNDRVLLDDIPDTPFGGEGRATVTLPDVECDRCTLQVVQVMYDKPPYVIPGNDIYYQCADLVLRRSSTSTPTSTPAATPTATASPTTAPSSPTIAPLPPCVGDCAQPGSVTRDDLRTGVTLALARTSVAPCLDSFDENEDGAVTVEELVAAVNAAVHGCAAAGAG